MFSTKGYIFHVSRGKNVAGQTAKNCNQACCRRTVSLRDLPHILHVFFQSFGSVQSYVVSAPVLVPVLVAKPGRERSKNGPTKVLGC